MINPNSDTDLQREPFDDDESDDEKYAAVDDAIEMLENMVKYGTIDKPKDLV